MTAVAIESKELSSLSQIKSVDTFQQLTMVNGLRLNVKSHFLDIKSD
jgi:hypothetical protein